MAEPSVVILPPNSPLTPVLYMVARSLRDSGLQASLERRWFSGGLTDGGHGGDGGSETAVLEMKQVMIVVAFMSATVGAAAIIFAAEIMYGVCKRRLWV